MRNELDELLCERYPKIFADRHKSMMETCMCWGFECGDGWFTIINSLCGNIQSHIDWQRKQKASALRYNRALNKAIKGDKAGLYRYYNFSLRTHPEWVSNQIDEDIKGKKFRKIKEIPAQVVASQVKEKFGTLRFYYEGGDEYISGLVSMAESMSANTCEKCGKPGTQTNGGWITTLCEEHMKGQE